MKISYSRYKNCHPMQMISDTYTLYVNSQVTVDNMEPTMVFNNFNLDLLPDDFKVNNGHLTFKYTCVPSLVFCSAKVRQDLVY